MTLVLAIRCRDGVVVASDGQATTDAAGQPTRRPVRKLFVIGGQIAWGAAGALGLQQTLAAELARRQDEVLAAADRCCQVRPASRRGSSCSSNGMAIGNVSHG